MSLSNSKTTFITIKGFDIYGVRYWYDNDPSVYIFIPFEPVYSKIAVHVLQGSTLYEAMGKAGDELQVGGEMSELYPTPPHDAMALAIRLFIYSAVNLIGGVTNSRPYGNGVWIHEQASRILQMYFAGRRFANDDPNDATIISGRMLLADGMMLPTLAEQDCITNYIRNSGRSLVEAFSLCGCSDILPPTSSIDAIEAQIKSTTWHMFTIYIEYIYKTAKPNPTCPTASFWDTISGNCKDVDGKVVDQVCPEGQIFDIATSKCKAKEPDKKNYMIYIALGIAAIFLLKGE